MSDNHSTLTEQEYFDKNVNISYVDSEQPVPDNKVILKHCLCSVVLYGFCVTLFWLNPWFADLMRPDIYGVSAKEFLTYIYFAYIVIAPIIYFCFKPKTIWHSHNIVIVDYLKRIFKEKNKLRALTVEEINKQLEFYKPNYKESQSIILFMIKLFFGTQMISYAFADFSLMMKQIPALLEIAKTFSAEALYTFLGNFSWQFYISAINIIFLIDVSVFTIGYFTEAAFLKNKVRSVDNTPAGILFCVICYPPFLNVTNSYFGMFFDRNDLSVFGNQYHWLTVLLHVLALGFIFIYATASVALFTKASNLTNRGTVSRWPYSMVRHPAYVCKFSYWICCALPLFIVNFKSESFDLYKYILVSSIMLLSLFVWGSVYYFRALTEERHLLKDPEYREYIKKVKYRFIPGLW